MATLKLLTMKYFFNDLQKFRSLTHEAKKLQNIFSRALEKELISENFFADAVKNA